MQIGGFIGTIIALGIPLFLNFSNSSAWNLYFMINIILISFLIPVSYLIQTNEPKETLPIESTEDEEIYILNIILVFLYIFLVYSDQLFQYPFEPWALDKYFGGSITLFSLFSIFLTIISLPGYIFALYFSDKIGKKRILIISSIVVAMMLMIGPFLEVMGFIIMVSIYLLMAGIILINLGAIMMKVSKGRVLYFQLIAVGIVLAKLIFVPLGTVLSEIIPTEFILFTSGALYLISIIPILLLKFDEKKE